MLPWRGCVHSDVCRHDKAMTRPSAKRKPSRNGKSPPNPAKPTVGTLAALTPREREVLRWLADGKRDAEIGTILGTSVRTIHKHTQSIYAKLGVETRTAAARIAFEAGRGAHY